MVQKLCQIGIVQRDAVNAGMAVQKAVSFIYNDNVHTKARSSRPKYRIFEGYLD